MHIGIVETSITGAGSELLRVAADKGYDVTLFCADESKYPENSLRPVRQSIACNTFDWASLFACAAAVHDAEPFDGITTVADLFVPQAAFLAEQFGLPGMPVTAACRARNKFAMRCRLQRVAPHLNPRFRLIRSEEACAEFLKEAGGDVIAKPQNANDSLGVRRLTSPADFSRYRDELLAQCGEIARLWLRDGILLEEYVEGPEYSCEVASYGAGQSSILGVCDKHLFGTERGHYAEIGISFPYNGPEAGPVADATLEGLAGLDITMGVTHTECRVSAQGVKIIEINPRLIGDMVGSHAIACATGRSPLEAVLDIAVGEFAGWNPKSERGGAMCALVAPEAGRFIGIRNLDAIRARPEIAEIRMVASPGQLVRPATDNGEVLMQLVAGGRNRAEAFDLAMAAVSACEVLIEAS